MIRPIAADEIHAFADMGGKFYQRMGLPGQFHYGNFTSVWENLLNNNSGFMLGRFKGDVPVECIGGINHADIYNAEPSTSGAFWFYSEPPVGLEAGILHNALEFSCRSARKKYLNIGVLENERAEKVSGHLLNGGYRLFEKIYRKEL